jgi:hypothetical protein
MTPILILVMDAMNAHFHVKSNAFLVNWDNVFYVTELMDGM